MCCDTTFSLISRLNHIMNSFVLRELARAGITGIVPSHGAILYALSGQKEFSLLGLAGRIGKSPQAVTTLVRKLEALGFVQIRVSAKDQRTKLVSLTEQGRCFGPVFTTVSGGLFRTQYTGMSPEEVETLRRLLGKMYENFTGEIKNRAEIPPAASGAVQL